MPATPAHPLLAALASGAPEAFATLYQQMAGPLLRTASLMLGDRGDAEDAVQDLFVNLVRSKERFVHVEDLDAYVFACLRHAVAQRAAKRDHERRNLQKLAMLRPQAERHSSESNDDLESAVASLPTGQREVVALKIEAGLTFAQMAQILGVSPNTAASRYRYALEKLRKILKEPM